jgi:hypothetical protein
MHVHLALRMQATQGMIAPKTPTYDSPSKDLREPDDPTPGTLTSRSQGYERQSS